MDSQSRTVTIKCCLCGLDFNPHVTQKTICGQCCKTDKEQEQLIHVKNNVINQCRHCGRYDKPPFMNIKRESQEMVSIMMKRMNNLNKVKIIDCKQIWTESHCKRLKLQVTYEYESVQTAVNQEFIENYIQCDDCRKEYTPHKWTSQIQLRQKAGFNKTLLYVEQQIYKYLKSDNSIIKQSTIIDKVENGLDIQYKNQKEAQSMLNFLSSTVIYRFKQSKQLISTDHNSNVSNYKYTNLCELPIVSKHDLIIIEDKKILQQQFGGTNKLFLCFDIGQYLKLLDVKNNKVHMLNSQQYESIENAIEVINFKSNSKEFMVLNSQSEDSSLTVNNTHMTHHSINSTQKYINLNLSKVVVSDMNDWQEIEVDTHIGNYLKSGDIVQGYHLTQLTSMQEITNIPEVIIIRKQKQKK